MTRGPSMQARRVDHIDISLDDLRAAKAFFLDLGFELMGEAYAEGEFVKRVIGLKGVRSEIAMLRTTDGGANIELVRLLSPVDDKALSLRCRIHMAHRDREKRSPGPGLQSETEGVEFIGEVLDYEDTYLDCYIRGPEGIILELAEELGRSSA